VTASNRAAAGVYADRGGPVLVAGLLAMGFAVDGPVVVPDGGPVEQALRDAVAAGYDVVLTTGGTGLTPTDRTPEATRAVLDAEVPGIAEAIRAHGLAHGVPTAMLSRGLAGRAGRTLVVNLPGSPGGCTLPSSCGAATTPRSDQGIPARSKPWITAIVRSLHHSR